MGDTTRPEVFELRLRGRPLLPLVAPTVDEVAERVWRGIEKGAFRNEAELRDALVEVCGSALEASPVGSDADRQAHTIAGSAR